jgi:GR25 family glycosyltransferase involved in LPS biosynthesis
MARLVESNEPMMAILEDDVRLSDDFPHVLACIEAQAGLFDVINLARGVKRKEFFVPCRHLTNSLHLGRLGYASTGAFGYVISRNAAQRFLLHTERLVDEVDRELHRYWINGLDIYGLTRPVVFHDAMQEIPSSAKAAGKCWITPMPTSGASSCAEADTVSTTVASSG